MKKLAVFVEGYTELLFASALIEQVAGANNVLIEQRRIRGGRTAPRKMALINAAKPHTTQQYFVLVVDCGGDDLVKTRITEEHANLTKQNYAKIIGMRDVRPKFTRAEIPKLELGLKKYIKTSLIPVEFVLQVMETEAWFLSEINHYANIDASITLDAIHAALGFDPLNDDMTLRPAPADDLNACYAIGGKSYAKGSASTTVSALDFGYVYLELSARISELGKLISALDDFLGEAA